MSGFYGYYKNVFPAEKVFELFTRKLENPEKREWGIETNDGKFIRWKACSSANDLRKLVCENDTGKLNIGAVYTEAVWLRWRQQAPMVAHSREFVIDLDLDDYGFLGVTKDNLHGCDAHWPLIATGLEVVKSILKSVFDFHKFLVVYSGRRGGHLWVLDERASLLNDAARSAILQFISPSEKENAAGRRSFKFIFTHPSFNIEENGSISPIALAISGFERYGIQSTDSKNGLGFLDTYIQRERFLEMIDARFSQSQLTFIMQARSGVDVYRLICQFIDEQPLEDQDVYGQRRMRRFRLIDTICTFMWPRCDVGVSTHMNHTLKSPYSVHPGTGRVSMPVFNSKIADFDPAIDAPLANALCDGYPHPNFDKNVLDFHKWTLSLYGSGKRRREGTG